MPHRAAYRVTYLYRPGRQRSARALAELVDELREVAGTCFDTLPEYQVLSGDRDALDRAVLTLARRPDGSLAGFCSALLLDVPGVGEVFHLGLTCVHPDARGTGLTHTLLSHVLARYLILHRPWSGAWFTNAASVLSSLGNVALHFEDVYPSPYRPGLPSQTHRTIARWISATHRERLHLSPTATFCERRFVFEGGNQGSVFSKATDDARYHHRDGRLTAWYAALACLDEGDAVLQVGRVSLGGYARYATRKLGSHVPGLRRWFTPRPALGVLGLERA